MRRRRRWRQLFGTGDPGARGSGTHLHPAVAAILELRAAQIEPAIERAEAMAFAGLRDNDVAANRATT